jgi:DNA-binding CsgD family transcriptional regulator
MGVRMLESRKAVVRHLYYEEGKTTREIARIERMSIRDISKIIKEEEVRKQSHEDDSQKQLEGKISAAAYSLFNQGKTPVEVAIELELAEPQVSKLYKEYLHLQGFLEIVWLCDKIGEDAWALLELYQMCNSSGMSNKEIVKAVDIALNTLPSADENYFQTRKKVNELVGTERQLLDHNEVLKAKNFSLINEMSDLEAQKYELIEYCNRRKQEVEELQKEQQQIQNMMTRHQQMIIGIIVGAFYFVFKLFETRLTKAIEILEMHEGDIV